MCGHDPGEHGLLVKFDVVQRLECQSEVTEQAMYPEKTDHGEVSQHLVQWSGAIFPGVQSGVLASLLRSQLLTDLRSLDERVQNIEYAVASPGVWVFAQNRNVLFVVWLDSELLSVAAEAVELVDEFVDDFPRPKELSCIRFFAQCIFASFPTHRWHFKVDWAVRIEDEMEEVAVAVVTCDLCF